MKSLDNLKTLNRLYTMYLIQAESDFKYLYPDLTAFERLELATTVYYNEDRNIYLDRINKKLKKLVKSQMNDQ